MLTMLRKNDYHYITSWSSAIVRGIKWSLRALAGMRAVRLFLQARAVIKYVLRAASTLKNSDSEQRNDLDLSYLKINVFRQVIWLTPFNQSQQLTANCTLLAMMSNYVTGSFA